MRKAFVKLAQGTVERIAWAMDFDRKRPQKTALQREFAPREDTCRRNTG